ncbi:hypothetical protein QEW_4667 [Clostridioides difficile CD160]|uniref:hypothetical protein n=1 Tax=unclassified Clostridioides TaxID=2635829 RepID=UPI00038D1A4D|nr:hypothetical protein QEW_4667 [Clostridioides difficile CD160]
MNRLMNIINKIKSIVISDKKRDGYELFQKYMSEEDYENLLERIEGEKYHRKY